MIGWGVRSPPQVAPGALLFLLMLTAPQSPRWLMRQRRDAAAADVVARLRGMPVDSASVQVRARLRATERGIYRASVAPVVAAERARRDARGRRGGPAGERRRPRRRGVARLAPRSGRAAAARRRVRPAGVCTRLSAGCAVAPRPVPPPFRPQIAQQWTGINVVLYYAAALFAGMGIDEGHASTSLVIVNALLLCAATVPGMILVEHRWGARLEGGGAERSPAPHAWRTAPRGTGTSGAAASSPPAGSR